MTTTEGKKRQEKDRAEEGRQGPSYKIESNVWLRQLVDAGTPVFVSLLGGSTPVGLTGLMKGFDAYNIFLLKGNGELAMIPKGAIRYILPNGKAEVKNG